MNLGEGTRRLALLLGVVGVIVGGFVSYMELQAVPSQRERHSRFERLVTSDVVQKERKCRLLGYTSGCSMVKLPPGATLDKPKYTIEELDGSPLASELSKGSISKIHWAKDYSVESIETDDGQTLYPTPAPSAWTYLWVSLVWIVPGFFIPWGVVRAIGWVGAGFVASQR
jgi:hypothetical protein